MFFVETGLLTLPMDLQYRYRYWYRPVLRDEVLVSVVSVKSGIGATLPLGIMLEDGKEMFAWNMMSNPVHACA